MKNARNILKVAELRLTINEINCFRFWLENILHKLFREDKYSLISGEFVMCANLELRRTKPRQPLHQSGNRQLHPQTTIQIQRRSERRVIAQCLSQRPGVILNLHPVQVNPDQEQEEIIPWVCENYKRINTAFKYIIVYSVLPYVRDTW